MGEVPLQPLNGLPKDFGVGFAQLSVTVSAGLPPMSPRKALRGGISKVNFHKVHQRLAIFSHKNEPMAPRTNLGYSHEGPSVATALPTIGGMDYALPGYPGHPLEVHCAGAARRNRGALRPASSTPQGYLAHKKQRLPRNPQ